jgi:two-component system aerobic respiration control sensor histidine kinase ArcB
MLNLLLDRLNGIGMLSMKQGGENQNIEKLTYALLKKYEHILGEDLHIIHAKEIIERIIRYHESITDCMPGNVFWLDKNCIAVGCNQNVLDMFGFKSAVDFKGLTFEEMGRLGNWTPQAIASFKKDTLEVINTGKGKLNIEEPPIPHHDGRVIYFLTSRVPLFNRRGAVVGVVGISIDITERKEMEELRIAMRKSEAANQAKSEFIANMSHNVKTPLSGMISFSEILHSHIQKEYRDITHDILEAGKHLMTFFDNCLELSKLESGSILLSKESFNLKRLLSELFTLLQPAIKAKNLTFHTDYDKKIPKQLLGSRVTLYRVLLNLLGNAIKFTPKGSVSLHVELNETSAPHQPIIKFIVADTGIGIPADRQACIFERFTRLTPSYEGVYEGSGIGLYIVGEFVKAMDGEVFVTSEAGKGSQFTIVVPFQVPLVADGEYDEEEDNVLSTTLSPIASAATKASVSADILPLSPKPKPNQSSLPKVLLVEDNLMAQNAAAMVLHSLGYEVDVAECGAEAIALFAPGKYRLVFMDIGLPDIKGYEVTAQLRKMEQGIPFHTPIFGLSAHATQEDNQLSIAAGMDEMHAKPLLLEQATLLVKKYLSESVPTAPPAETSSLWRMENDLRIIDLPNTRNHANASEQAAWKMLDELIASLPAFRASIEQVYKAEDVVALINHVHKFQGGVCYTHTPHLLHAVRTLEMRLKNGEHDHAAALYQSLLKALDLLEKTYQAL